MTSIPKLLAQTVSLSKLFSCTSPRYVCVQLSLVPPAMQAVKFQATIYIRTYVAIQAIIHVHPQFSKGYSNAVNKFYTAIRRI